MFPRVTGERGALEIRRLPESESASLLTGGLFGVQSGTSTSEVFSVPSDPPPPDLPALAARCRELAARVPCFRCDMGLDAFAPGSAREFLRALPL